MILGVDISTTATGFAFVHDGKLITSGVISPTSKNFLTRGYDIADEISNLLLVYEPDAVVYEDFKVMRNQSSLKKLAIVAGMTLSKCKNFPVVEVGPTEWRKKYGFKGKRSELKKKAIDYVDKKFSLKATDDEAEALLIALYGEDLQKIWMKNL